MSTTSAPAKVGLEEHHLVGRELGTRVDSQGVGVIVEKPRVPRPRPCARHGQVRPLAPAHVRIQLAICHQILQRRLIPADTDPEGAPIKTPGPPQVQAKGPGERGGLGEVIGDGRGVVGLRPVERHRDVPVVGIRPPHLRAGETADGA